MSVEDTLCATLNADINKHTNQLRGMKTQLSSYKKSLNTILASFVPTIGFSVPVLEDLSIDDFVEDCQAATPKMAKSSMLKSYNPFEGIDLPEVDIGDKIEKMNSLFDGVSISDKLTEMDTILSCLSYTCGFDVSTIADDIDNLVDELDVDEETGTLDMNKVFSSAGVVDVDSLISDVTDMDNLKNEAKDVIKNLF